jgi:hypothetical protein
VRLSPINCERLSVVGRITLALVLVVLATVSTREGIAAWLGRRGTTDAVRNAQALDPANPNLGVTASEIFSNSPDSDPESAVRVLESANRSSPNRAFNWALLAEAGDAAGNAPLADGAFQRGLALFPRSPKINWMYANFLIRSGDSARSLARLRLAIDGDPSLREGAFDLAWRAGFSPSQILIAVPARSDTLSTYLDYLALTNRLDAAKDVWSRLDSAAERPELGAALHYFDSLLYAHQVDEMVAVWSALRRRDPPQPAMESSAANLVTNGSFEVPPLNGGFDWRLVPVEGAQIFIDSTVSREGSDSLCIIFEGAHNLEFTHIAQYVLVEPNSHYRFSAYVRGDGITTDSGPRFAIYDAFDRKNLSLATPSMTGTFDWQEQQLQFATGPETRLIVLQVLRPASHKLDAQIGGTLWLDSITLTKL